MSNNIGATPGTGATLAAQDISQGTAPTTGLAPASILVVSANGTSAPTVVTDANPLPVGVQGTVPVSAASLPLPTGAATAANQATEISTLSSIASSLGGTLIVSGTVGVTGVATAAKQDTGNTSLASIDGKITACNTGAVVVSSGTLTANLGALNGAATAAKQPALGTAGSASTDVISVQGIASMTPLLVDGSAHTQPVSIASAVTVAQAAAASLNATVVGTGTFLVQAAQSGTWSTTVTQATGTNLHTVVDSGTVTANIGTTNGLALDTTLTGGTQKTLLYDGTNTIGTAAHPVQVSLANTAANGTAVKVDGSAVTQPVSNGGTFATQAAQSGTWTVQPGNTANTTAWLTTETPSTSNGLSMYRRLSTADTNLDTAKASAGRLYSGFVSNTNASPRFLKIYDKASNPVLASDTPKWTVLIPGNASGAAGSIKFHGLQFSNGIAIAITGAVGDTDTTAISANEVIVNLGYK